MILRDIARARGLSRYAHLSANAVALRAIYAAYALYMAGDGIRLASAALFYDHYAVACDVIQKHRGVPNLYEYVPGYELRIAV